MARGGAITRTVGGGGRTTVQVRIPPGLARAGGRAARAGAHLARRGATAAARAAASERHTIAAVVGAAVLGYVEREDMDIPHFESIGRPGTIGIALWVAGRFTRNPMLQHAATGALSIAVYEAVKDSDDSSGGGRRRRRRAMGGSMGNDDEG